MSRGAAFSIALTLAGCNPAERSSVSPLPPADRAPLRAEVASPAAPVDAGEDAAPAAPAAPDEPYDLAADQQRRARLAREELGPGAASTIVADVFVVIGPAGREGRHYERSVALMKRATAAYLDGRFGKKPREAISVYLFPDAAGYEAFCTKKYAAPCIAQFGFYQPRDRSMVMNIGLGLGTLTHEIVHPFVEADFPEAPTWLNEGIASLFEQPLFPRAGAIHGGKNWRHPRLARALSTSERDRARLDRLFGMRDEAFRERGEDLNYATARYVCQWLDERGKLWPFYRRWRDRFAEDPTGEQAFKDVVGMTPAEAHAVWAKWVLRL